jgi:hypothetical protein
MIGTLVFDERAASIVAVGSQAMPWVLPPLAIYIET